MLRTSAEYPRQEMIEFATQWLNMCAQDRLAEACSMIDLPNAWGTTWTPESIRKLVAETFSSDTLFGTDHPEGPMFTQVDETTRSDHVHLGAYEDDSGFWLDHDVPLNGEWSDLTAQFEFLKQSGGLAVVLINLHVL